MPEREYYLPASIFWNFNDASDDERLARLAFHVERGDYFPFLATVVGLLKETINESAGREKAATEMDFAESMRKDLLYLHEHYDLVPKAVPLSFSREKAVVFPA
jgi:hypothetical protein